jgi:hypothetical protein
MAAAYPMFEAALQTCNLARVLQIARTMPRLSLADAAQVLDVMANAEDAHPHLYERAAVRWRGRYCQEVSGVTVEHAARAVTARNQIDQDPNALSVLLGPSRSPNAN